MLALSRIKAINSYISRFEDKLVINTVSIFPEESVKWGIAVTSVYFIRKYLELSAIKAIEIRNHVDSRSKEQSSLSWYSRT